VTPLRAIAILALATIGLAGCGACKDDKPKPGQPPAPRSASVPTRPGQPVKTPERRITPGSVTPGRMATVTLDEITPVVPTIVGATVFSSPRVSPRGEQVHLAWCIDAADQAAARAAVKAGLIAEGWGEIHDRGQGPRVAVSGDRPPYRIAASISSAPREGCSPADGKWFTSVSMYKIESAKHPPILDEPGAGSAVIR
jgi:hypothetical protein